MRYILILLFIFSLYISNAQTIPVYTLDKKETEKPKMVTPAKKAVTPVKTKKEITDGYVVKSSKIANDTRRFFNHSCSYYSGAIKNGKANGYGKLYDDGGILFFEGYFENNDVISGKEQFQSLGSTFGYEGTYKNGKRHGEGKRYMDKEVDIGIFENGNYITGKSYIPNGDIFEGVSWFNKIGKTGKYTFANGDIYEGNFSGSKMHGQGKYTWKNGVNYTGEFSNNIIIGQGTLVFSDNTYNNKYFVTSETRNICLYSKESNKVIKCWDTYKISETKVL